MKLFTILAMTLAGALPVASQIRYHARIAPDESAVHVEIKVPARRGPAVFIIPRSIPMGYGTAPYDRFVEELRALDDEGGPIEIRRARMDIGPRWTLGGEGSTLETVRYRVDIRAMERTILQASDSSKMRAGYAGLLGYSIFGFVQGMEAEPIQLEISAPKEWPVFTTLAPREKPARGIARAAAADFYALADSQIVAGPAVKVRRIETTPPLFIACYAECGVDLAVVGKMAAKALSALVDWFRSTPFDHYTVHLEFLKPLSPRHEYGFSMEHLDSTTIFLGVDRAITDRSSPDQRGRMLYNLAHHMAHSWIPKRCAMKGYFPFNWEVAPVLDSIWFSEGFGQWAAMDALGLALPDGKEQRARLLANRFRRYAHLVPRYVRDMHLVSLSRLASSQYSSNFATGLAVFSRGALMAESMDVEIRRVTKGKKGLRDGLVALMAHAAAKKGPIDSMDLIDVIRETTGVDVTRQITEAMRPVR